VATGNPQEEDSSARRGRRLMEKEPWWRLWAEREEKGKLKLDHFNIKDFKGS
jgi:hypothetical protein